MNSKLRGPRSKRLKGLSASSVAKLAAAGPQNEHEAAAVDRYTAKWQGDLAPSFKASRIAGDIEIDHPDNNTGLILLAEAIGGPHPDFLASLLQQLKICAMDAQLKIRFEHVNFALSFIKDFKPRDLRETLLAMQMVQVHAAFMDASRRLRLASNRQERETENRAINALARTFAAQLEALKRYRSSGEQRVVVQHVTQNVGEGGQAIGVVGVPGESTGEKGKTDERSHASISFAGSAAGAALQCAVEEESTALPGGSDERQTSVSDARGTRRRSAR